MAGLAGKSYKEPSGEMEMFFMVKGAWSIQIYTLVRTVQLRGDFQGS